MSANILSPEERLELTTIPTEISDIELVRFTLSPADLSIIDPRLGPAYRFDQVAHVCLLCWLGWSPVVIDRLPDTAHIILCQQIRLKIPVGSLQPPSARTSRLHAERAQKYLGGTKYTLSMDPSLMEWLKLTERFSGGAQRRPLQRLVGQPDT
jgi:hypothetical protein